MKKNKKSCTDNKKIFLYQYKSINDYTISNLEAGKVWLSSPRLFNDPYDSKLFMLEDDVNKLIEYCLKNRLNLADLETENLKQSKEYLNFFDNAKDEILNTTEKDVFVSCFSELYKSILMWSHYADYHKGICIKYDKKDLDNFVVRKKMHLEKVLYSLKSTITAEEYLKVLDNNSCKEEKDECSKEIVKKTVFNKNKCWKYEKEWRIVCFRDEEKVGADGFDIELPKPVAIYMGTNIKDEDRNFIENLCREKEIELYQMKMKKDKVELIEKRVEL